VFYTYSALQYGLIATTLVSIVGCAGLVLNIGLQGCPLNGRKGTAQKVLFSSRKVDFIFETRLETYRCCRPWRL